MDIWAWYNDVTEDLWEAGEHRFVHILEELSTLACSRDHASFDAVYPEALALAKASDHPWLEIFVRHWNLQSRLFKRADVRDCLPEAVSLVELASREGNRECPQRICASQDLAQAYAQLDGPGYAVERAEAVRETIASIDPKWSCWGCLHGELAYALLDGGDPTGALKVIDEAVAAAGSLSEHDQQYVRNRFLGDKVWPLLALGRAEDALAECVEPVEGSYDDESLALGRRLARAAALVALGRLDEGLEALGPFDSIRDETGEYEDWAPTRIQLIRGGAVDNDPDERRTFRSMQMALVERDARRGSVDIGLMAAELATEAGLGTFAGWILDDVEAVIPRLAAPLGADVKLAAARAAATAEVADVSGFESSSDLLEALPDDPAAGLPMLAAGLDRWSTDRGLLGSGTAPARRSSAAPTARGGSTSSRSGSRTRWSWRSRAWAAGWRTGAPTRSLRSPRRWRSAARP